MGWQTERYEEQISRLEAERDALNEQMMTVQVGSEYQLGHEHGSVVAVKYKAERDAARADADRLAEALREVRLIDLSARQRVALALYDAEVEKQ